MRSGSSSPRWQQGLGTTAEETFAALHKTPSACVDFASSWMPSASPSDRKLRSASISPPTDACWMWREDQADSLSKLGVNIRTCAATRRDLDNEADVHKCLPQTTLHCACCGILRIVRDSATDTGQLLKPSPARTLECCAVSK